MENINYDGEQLSLIIKIVSKLNNIEKDKNGIYFWGGKCGEQLECDENKEILEDNERRMMKLFKHHNWSNMRKGKYIVGNHLRFLLCKLTDKKVYDSKVVKVGNIIIEKKNNVIDDIKNTIKICKRPIQLIFQHPSSIKINAAKRLQRIRTNSLSISNAKNIVSNKSYHF